MAEEDGQERSLEPSARKLEQARQKGDVPIARELVSLGVFVGALTAWLGFGPEGARRIGTALLPFLDRPDSFLTLEAPGAVTALAGETAVALAIACAPFFLLPAMGALLAYLAQQAVVVASTRIAFKANRISPLANAKQRFGMTGITEFGRTLLQVTATGVLVALVVNGLLDALPGTVALDPRAQPGLLTDLTGRLLTFVVAATVLIGTLDAVWQRFDHLRRLRMTQKEMTDEMKETEGNPHMKQARRARATAAATNRMLQDVPRADVVIANPTHYAVALKWDRDRKGAAPTVVAKGTDELALTIKRLAAEHRVPIREDKPLARSLHALVEVGQDIRVEHYRAVAAALHFANVQRTKMRRPASPSASAP